MAIVSAFKFRHRHCLRLTVRAEHPETPKISQRATDDGRLKSQSELGTRTPHGKKVLYAEYIFNHVAILQFNNVCL